MGASHVDLLDPDTLINPYPLYSRLREQSPVHWTVTPDGGRAWLITRHHDAQRLLRDPRLLKDRRNAMQPQAGSSTARRGDRGTTFRHMLDTDPPEHTRLRGCVHRAFTQKVINALVARIEAVANRLIDQFDESGEVDLVEHYAAPMAVTVIAELLGVPPADQAQFRKWAEAMTPAGPFAPAQVQAAFAEFSRYFHSLVGVRKERPADDLLSELLRESSRGERLSSEELYSMILFLLIAGHETSLNLIVNGILALLGNPEQLQTLREDPGQMAVAIEELLRYDGPVRITTSRYLTETCSIEGVSMRPGDQVLVLLGSVNRDPAAFVNPDALDVSRATNRHLSFGVGTHFCLGAQLARAEAAIALRCLLLRTRDVQLAKSRSQLAWLPSLFIRGVRSLPVRLHRNPSAYAAWRAVPDDVDGPTGERPEQ